MSLIEQDLTPRQAWQPLPESEWDAASAAHLLRRIGFSARPVEVQRALAQGPKATVKAAFSQHDFPVPTAMWDASMEIIHLRKSLRGKSEDEKRQIRREIRTKEREGQNDFADAWLEFARDPQHSAQEKYVLFLESVFVVAAQKIRNAGEIYDHQNLLRREGFGSYRDLTKSVSRSPAMIKYLDLHRSTKKAPNENFGRELMELFTLGEGNYTEQDIKAAARAFTGYRTGTSEYYFSEFRFAPHQYDSEPKTFFGRTGRWNGDEIIEIIFEQPAAQTFLPRELGLFYLDEEPIPEPYLKRLGNRWARQDFDLSWLLETFFTSRLFYAPQFRGNLIKSPIHYYIGLCQDLNLDVFPVPQRIMSQLRNMGQPLQNPPNVRGWLGGKHWITASTLSARQLAARQLIYPINEKRLNADERELLKEARADGKGPFMLDSNRLEPLLERDNRELVDHLCHFFLPQPPSDAFRAQLVKHISASKDQRAKRVREAVLALLQSPAYQLS